MTEEKCHDKYQAKFLKHFANGLTRNIILWIISKEKIHGYGIMKKLEEFFDFENINHYIKITSSKVYPILRMMEEEGLIIGEWDINENNKRVKYYSITEKGLNILDKISFALNFISKNPAWIAFSGDMGVELNEKRD